MAGGTITVEEGWFSHVFIIKKSSLRMSYGVRYRTGLETTSVYYPFPYFYSVPKILYKNLVQLRTQKSWA